MDPGGIAEQVEVWVSDLLEVAITKVLPDSELGGGLVEPADEVVVPESVQAGKEPLVPILGRSHLEK